MERADPVMAAALIAALERDLQAGIWSWERAKQLARVMAKVQHDPSTKCWNWVGNMGPGGYGQERILGKKGPAHRRLYEILVGPVSRAFDLDHLCRNRSCVNPDHLEPVTRAVNIARALAHNGHKTHCPQGHPYDDENTSRNPNGSRKCKTCMRERKVYARQSEERAEREREIRRASYHRNKGECLLPGKDRTHCPKGHEYTPENTLHTTSGGRFCRECRRAYERDLRARKRAATARAG